MHESPLNTMQNIKNKQKAYTNFLSGSSILLSCHVKLKNKMHWNSRYMYGMSEKFSMLQIVETKWNHRAQRLFGHPVFHLDFWMPYFSGAGGEHFLQTPWAKKLIE